MSSVLCRRSKNQRTDRGVLLSYCYRKSCNQKNWGWRWGYDIYCETCSSDVKRQWKT